MPPTATGSSPTRADLRAGELCLEVDGLVKDMGPVASLDGKMVRILDGVDFTARFGTITVLMGANGAGKSTTLACAQGMMPVNGGSIRLLGEDPFHAGAALRARVGVMLQDGGLPPALRPIELLKHLATMYQKPRNLDELITALDLNPLRNTPIRKLSGGEKQRVALAAALIGDPEVVFLDEPSAGLDPESRLRIFTLIEQLRSEGLGIVLTTHLLDDAQKLADYVYIINHGVTVAHGTVAELTSSQSGNQQKLLRFSCEIPLDLRELAASHNTPAELHLTEVTPGTYEVQGNLDAAGLNTLASWWQSMNINPTEIAMKPRSLEDVYFEFAAKNAPGEST